MPAPQHAAAPAAFQFTNDWFGTVARKAWDMIIPRYKPQRILEIGSYEGASACYLIQTLAPHFPIELHCVDPWPAADGDNAIDGDAAVEARFDHNTALAISGASNTVSFTKHKAFSGAQLVQFLAEGKQNYFDFIYIDGAHKAPDVLLDAVLAFRLLKVGGILAFDDYLGGGDVPFNKHPLELPKLAIDAFTNIYCQKINIVSPLHYQLYVQKMAD